jgi:hypothetical protein
MTATAPSKMVKDLVQSLRQPAAVFVPNEGGRQKGTGLNGDPDREFALAPDGTDRDERSGLLAKGCHPTISTQLPARSQGTFDFPVRLVLTDSVRSPDRRGYPSEQSDLQNEADDPGNRTTDGEECQPRQQECDKQAHGAGSS